METSNVVVGLTYNFQIPTLPLSNGESHGVSATFLLRTEIETFCETLFSVGHNKSVDKRTLIKLTFMEYFLSFGSEYSVVMYRYS
jgi:hypothetical protein